MIQSQLDQIEAELRAHDEKLDQHVAFSSAKIVSRHKLQLEKALNQGESFVTKV